MAVTTKIVQMLAIMEHSPRYAMQMAKTSPELFSTAPPASALTTPPSFVSNSSVYKMLKTAQRSGLVEKAKNYEPPTSVRALMDPDARGPIVWWQITPKGRNLLNELRATLSVQPRRRNARARAN